MKAPLGSPPTLEWIAVDRLSVDESYQRATDSTRSRKLITRISNDWNWHFCQPLAVARRVDGSLFVIDGQHRLAAAVARGDLPHLPCVVISGTDSGTEAAAFVALNTQRQALSQGNIFNAMLASSDETAKHVSELLAQTGWRMARTSNPTYWKAGDLFCAPMIVKAVKMYGEEAVRNGLTALREAYPDKPVANVATLLTALFTLYRDSRVSDPDLLIETLAEVEPADWEVARSDIRRRRADLSQRAGMVEAIAESCTAVEQERVLAA